MCVFLSVVVFFLREEWHDRDEQKSRDANNARIQLLKQVDVMHHHHRNDFFSLSFSFIRHCVKSNTPSARRRMLEREFFEIPRRLSFLLPLTIPIPFGGVLDTPHSQ